jgi:hypothetical protein
MLHVVSCGSFVVLSQIFLEDVREATVMWLSGGWSSTNTESLQRALRGQYQGLYHLPLRVVYMTTTGSPNKKKGLLAGSTTF